MRLLVELDAYASIVKDPHVAKAMANVRRLNIPFVVSTDGPTALLNAYAHLQGQLAWMEANAARYRLPPILAHNLKIVAKELRLSHTERKLLAYASLIRSDFDLCGIAMRSERQSDIAQNLAATLKSPLATVRKAIRQNSTLHRSGLLRVRPRSEERPRYIDRFDMGVFGNLVRSRVRSIDDLIDSAVRRTPRAAFALDDFAHVSPDVASVATHLTAVLDTHRPGVNVLIYGPPGTGKTELARALAQAAKASAFEVPTGVVDEKPMSPQERLETATAAQELLGRRRSVLVFDEIDAVFGNKSPFTAAESPADANKAWVNRALEHTPTPTIWIANQVWRMDDAFVRRFDLVLRLDAPPLAVRERIVTQLCGDFLDNAGIRRLAFTEHATPAIVARAAQVVRELPIGDADKTREMEAIVDGVLRAQNRKTVRQANRDAGTTEFDPALIHCDTDLDILCRGLRERPSARICLHGPPGTGKTAFGKWLARELGRPLALKRASDLLSPWLGETEQNLAKAFEHAERDGAILQIDEVDGYLRDRRSAERAWEHTQVNEFLTQLEAFDGIFIASTNLEDTLDPAALRRFDFKLRMEWMRREQALILLNRHLRDFGLAPIDLANAERLDGLAPGDFAVVARRHHIRPFVSGHEVLEALVAERTYRGGERRRIGYV